MLKRMVFPVFLTFLFGVAGCASYKYGKIDVLQPEKYPNHTAVSGISLAADPYDSVEKAKAGFYVDVNSKRYYPVHLIFSNDSNERVMLEREKIQLIDGDGNQIAKVRSTVMADECEHNKMAYALLGFGIFSYMSADDANKKMAADWRDKELVEQVIIAPGKKANGFLYFRIPERKNVTGYRLQAELEKIDSKETVALQIALGQMGKESGPSEEAKESAPHDPLHPNQ